MLDNCPILALYKAHRTPSRIAGTVVLGFSGVVMLAWLFAPRQNLLVAGLLLPMKANTALALATLAAALIVSSRQSWPYAAAAARLMAAGAAAIAAQCLLEYLLGTNLGLDQALVDDVVQSTWPGRMSPLSATLIILFAAAQLGHIYGRARALVAAQALAFLVLAASGLTLLAHAYQARALLRLGAYVPMAWTTAAALLLLAFGLLASRNGQGLTAALGGRTAAARMGRGLLASTCLILPALAWLRLQGQSLALYDAGLGTTLVVGAGLLLLGAVILLHTATAHRAELRIAYLNRVYSMLSEVNALIVRAVERDELFTQASRIAVERGGFPRAWFGLVDADAGAVCLVAGADAATLASPGLRERLSLASGGPGPSPIARAVLGACPIVVNDVALELDDPFRDELLAGGIQSFAVLPLILEGRVFGIFKLHAEVPNFFHAEELALLGELAGDIAYAVSHIAQRQELDRLAFYDALTGLANPRLLDDRLNQAIAAARRQRASLALMVFDIVRFKTVNDAYGRRAGDDALQAVARRLAQACGEAACGRLGSNLFAVIVPELHSAASMMDEHDRIVRRCFNEAFEVQGQRISLAVRAGIACLARQGDDARHLLNHAEAALDAARALNQRASIFDARRCERNAERLALQARLAHALENTEFALHYQMKIDCRTSAPCGAEALLRWIAPGGEIGPMQFIPLLEGMGMIDEVGDWVLRQASDDNSRQIQPLHPNFRIAVNVSAAQLMHPDFVRRAEAALEGCQHRHQIDLELTESLLLTDIEVSIDKLRRLRACGLRIAIDDFGTGYSSMAYLARLPLDYLKIDRTFVQGLPEARESRAIIASIIGLGHALGLQVIAEGIENAAQARVLAELGCDQLQGYYFGQPEPLPSLLRRLRTGDSLAGGAEMATARPG